MSADCEAKTGSAPTGALAERIRQEAVHLTPHDIRRALKGIPLKAKLALRAATLLGSAPPAAAVSTPFCKIGLSFASCSFE